MNDKRRRDSPESVGELGQWDLTVKSSHREFFDIRVLDFLFSSSSGNDLRRLLGVCKVENGKWESR